MIKFSTKGRYALRALVDLAEMLSAGEKKYISLKEIAERQEISIKYLEALFSTLKNAGIIASQRGARGGYYLSRKPEEITAIEVIESIEGPIAVVDCCVTKGVCDRYSSCRTVVLWKEINDCLIAKLKTKTVRDLFG